MEDIINDDYLYDAILYEEERKKVNGFIECGYTRHLAILATLYGREEFKKIFDYGRSLNPDYVLDNALREYIMLIRSGSASISSNTRDKVMVKTSNNARVHSGAAFVDTFILCLLANLTIFLILLGIIFAIKMN